MGTKSRTSTRPRLQTNNKGRASRVRQDRWLLFSRRASSIPCDIIGVLVRSNLCVIAPPFVGGFPTSSLLSRVRACNVRQDVCMQISVNTVVLSTDRGECFCHTAVLCTCVRMVSVLYQVACKIRQDVCVQFCASTAVLNTDAYLAVTLLLYSYVPL